MQAKNLGARLGPSTRMALSNRSSHLVSIRIPI